MKAMCLGMPAALCATTVLCAAQQQDCKSMTMQVLDVRPHDSGCYTQGLELWGDKLYESGGLYGQSTLRTVDPQNGTVLKKINLSPTLFAEGITSCPAGLWILTWKENTTTLFDPQTLTSKKSVRYKGEGWGLCYDGQKLIMSDGSSMLTMRDATTFDVLSTVTVTLGGTPQKMLNELEYANGSVYANIYQTDTIVRIHPKTGAVTGFIDCSGLLSPDEKRNADVLNGIAYDRKTGNFLITGKNWPKLFEVQFTE